VVVVTILPIGLICALVIGVFAAIVRDRARTARFTRAVAVVMALAFGALAALFIAGEALTDPGGAAGWVITAAWAVPMVGASVWAWLSPRTAEPLVWIAVSAVVLLSAWWAVDSDGWSDLMDARGPVIPVAALAVGVPVAVWGFRRPLRGGAALLAVGLGPIVAASLASGGQAFAVAGAVGAITGPLFVAGGLYLLAWLLARRATATDSAAPDTRVASGH
jgi:hypothetical protein